MPVLNRKRRPLSGEYLANALMMASRPDVVNYGYTDEEGRSVGRSMEIPPAFPSARDAYEYYAEHGLEELLRKVGRNPNYRWGY